MTTKGYPDPFLIDDDNPEWTEEEIKRAKLGKEFFEELGISPPKPRGRPVSDNPKVRVNIRLDADIVESFKKEGKGWQTRVNDALRQAIKKRA